MHTTQNDFSYTKSVIVTLVPVIMLIASGLGVYSNVWPDHKFAIVVVLASSVMIWTIEARLLKQEQVLEMCYFIASILMIPPMYQLGLWGSVMICVTFAMSSILKLLGVDVSFSTQLHKPHHLMIPVITGSMGLSLLFEYFGLLGDSLSDIIIASLNFAMFILSLSVLSLDHRATFKMFNKKKYEIHIKPVLATVLNVTAMLVMFLSGAYEFVIVYATLTLFNASSVYSELESK